MPFYRFIIHGRGPLTNGALGFFTTRWCWAPNPDKAAEKALRLVRKDWEPETPVLEVDKGWHISFFDIWKGPNRGHTFYDKP